MRSSNVVVAVSLVLSMAALATVMAIPGSAQADLIAHHYGQTNPTSAGEGWTVSNNGVTVGPIDDGGVNAWLIDDNYSTASAYYHKTVSDSQLLEAATKGWTFEFTLKMVDSENKTSAGLYFANGTNMFLLCPSVSGGDQAFALLGTSSVGDSLTLNTLTGTGSSYQNYKISYDPATAKASVYVGGQLKANNWAGVADTEKELNWYTDSTRLSELRLASLEFSTVPEPGTLVLLGAGLLGLLAYAWRKRR